MLSLKSSVRCLVKEEAVWVIILSSSTNERGNSYILSVAEIALKCCLILGPPVSSL